MNFRGDTVATRQGREFEHGEGRMETGGSCYYGYLQKIKRPAQGRRRVVKLPYSEL